MKHFLYRENMIPLSDEKVFFSCSYIAGAESRPCGLSIRQSCADLCVINPVGGADPAAMKAGVPIEDGMKDHSYSTVAGGLEVTS